MGPLQPPSKVQLHGIVIPHSTQTARATAARSVYWLLPISFPIVCPRALHPKALYPIFVKVTARLYSDSSLHSALMLYIILNHGPFFERTGKIRVPLSLVVSIVPYDGVPVDLARQCMSMGIDGERFHTRDRYHKRLCREFSKTSLCLSFVAFGPQNRLLLCSSGYWGSTPEVCSLLRRR